MAGAQRKEPFDQLQDDLDAGLAGVGPEVGGAVLDDAAGDEDAGEALILDANIGIAFIVAQHYIVARQILLDQGVFQQQGVGLRFHHRKLQAAGVLDHHAGLVGTVPAVAEIGGHAAAQVLGLAHVEDGVLLVDKAVDARLPGDGIGDGLVVVGGHCSVFGVRCSVFGIRELRTANHEPLPANINGRSDMRKREPVRRW